MASKPISEELENKMKENSIHQDVAPGNEKNECSCPMCHRTPTDLRTNNDGAPVNFAYSRTCGHIYCLPCIEQRLLAPSFTELPRTKRQLKEDETLVTTTLGACPVCRTELSYFDLMKVLLIETSGEENASIATVIKSKDPVIKSDPMHHLDGMMYQSARTGTEFPKALLMLPDGGMDGAILGQKAFQNMSPPHGMVELSGCRYLAKTHTLMAQGKGEKKKPDTEYTLWFTFSDNFQFITHGVCRKVVREKFYEDVVGESYPQLRTKVTTWVYPFSATDTMRMCLVKHSKGLPRLPHHKETFWGSIFCQKYKVGLASYHFVKKPKVAGRDEGAVAYMSFDHKMIGDWPPLDNGRPLPSRVVFRNTCCPDQQTFRGSICWYDDYQTTWKGSSRWDCEVHFDSSFSSFRYGTICKIGKTTCGAKQGSEIETIGVDVPYINAGVGATLGDSIASEIVTIRKSEQIAWLESTRQNVQNKIDEYVETLRTNDVTELTRSCVRTAMQFPVNMLVAQLLARCQRKPFDLHERVPLPIAAFDFEYYLADDFPRRRQPPKGPLIFCLPATDCTCCPK